MSQVDEGLIHAWLDGQLSPAEAERIEKLVETDAAWGAAAAEARGLLAGSSRILSALDDVPSVRSAGAAGGAGGGVRTKRSVWRAPWLQAAAVLVVAAGIGGLVIEQWPGERGVPSTAQTAVLDGAPQPGMKDARSESAASKPATVPSSVGAAGARDRIAPSAPAGETKRNESVTPKSDPRLDVVRATGDAGGASNAATRALPNAGAGVAAAAAPRQASIDSIRAGALVVPQAAPLIAPATAGIANSMAGRVGVAGGRGGRGNAVEMRDQLSAKAFTEPKIIDARLSGCWLPVDSAPSASYVLRFVDPLVTDVQAAPVPLVERQAAAPVAPKVLPRVPAGARVENATPRKFAADTVFSAEWVTGNGRTTLIFTVRADTIVGTTHLAAGDIRYPPAAFRALRAQCPQ